MCIAIVKPIGEDFPPKERLKNCFDNNPHSIGVGTTVKGTSYISVMKFFDFDVFYNFSLNHFAKRSETVFIHFRYATHGSIDLNNCHPFFISDNQTQFQTNNLLMHNGVFQLGKLQNGKSDTLTIAEKIYREKLELDNDLITRSNNKVAILINNRSYKLYGNWIKADDGCYYSNGSYRKSLEIYKKKYNNQNLVFCDCCGEIGEGFLTTEVGYHFCNDCLQKVNVYMYKCIWCGNVTADKICGKCSEEKNISLKYWY